MVELREAEMLAHHMESYLRALREREARLTAAGLDALIAASTRSSARLPRAAMDMRRRSIEAIVGSLEAVMPTAVAASGSEDAAAPQAAWRVTFAPRPSCSRAASTSTSSAPGCARRDESSTPRRRSAGGSVAFEFLVAGELDEATVGAWRADGIEAEPVAGRAGARPPPRRPRRRRGDGGARLAPSHVVRVDLTRLDELMRIIGDLVISRARLDGALAPIERRVPPVEWRAVQENSQTIERQLRDLREGVMRVRLVPVGEIFRRMPFVVRDLARETGKQVRLELRGQDTEIDKFLIERMMDPVLHLVRNAVSHGFEDAGRARRRRQAGGGHADARRRQRR